MNAFRVSAIAATLCLLSACDLHDYRTEIVVDELAIQTAVEDVLATQQAAWNRGDIPGFMEGYWKSDELRFASGGSVTHGWQETLDRYTRNYGEGDPAKMGELNFSDLVVEATSPDDALVFGKWQLTLADESPWGLFTLHFENVDGQWVIVSDHTSSDQ